MRIDRRKTCEMFVKNWRAQWGELNYTYPGHYFNAGVMVFDAKDNPFIIRADGQCCFNNDPLVDQTYVNVISAKTPKTLFDWKWNRMGIDAAHKFHKSTDMLEPRPYIAHYCGMSGKEKIAMPGDLLRVLPPAIERKPGARLQGLYDWWNATDGSIKRMAEIGSAHGESAWVWTDCNPDLELTCVDPHDTPRYGEQAKADFLTRHGWNKNVKLISGYGVDVAAKIPDGSLDAVYIDAVHEYKDVLADCRGWLPKIRKGGYIGGHDYTSRDRAELPAFPGCVKAVNEVFGAPDMVFQDSSWIVRKV